MKPFHVLIALAAPATAIRIVLGNDHGWATSNTRLLFDLLNQTHQVVLSAPADDKSGEGDDMKDPVRRKKPCQWDTCPANSPPYGHYPAHPELNYVNSYAPTAMQWGIDTFGPSLWDGKTAELVVSGVNYGNTLGQREHHISSAVHAAVWPIKFRHIPGIVFSGEDTKERPYFEPAKQEAVVYSQLANKLVNELVKSGVPYLPEGVYLNVNFPMIRDECDTADKVRFIITRVNREVMHEWGALDPQWCGTDLLPDEGRALDVNLGGSYPCTATISVSDTGKKNTENSHEKQLMVMDKLKHLVECPVPEWKWLKQWEYHIGQHRYASEECYHMPFEKRGDCWKEKIKVSP